MAALVCVPDALRTFLDSSGQSGVYFHINAFFGGRCRSELHCLGPHSQSPRWEGREQSPYGSCRSEAPGEPDPQAGGLDPGGAYCRSASCQCWVLLARRRPAEGLPVTFPLLQCGGVGGAELVPGRCWTGLPRHCNSQAPSVNPASLLFLQPPGPSLLPRCSLHGDILQNPSWSSTVSPSVTLSPLLQLSDVTGGISRRVPLFHTSYTLFSLSTRMNWFIRVLSNTFCMSAVGHWHTVGAQK